MMVSSLPGSPGEIPHMPGVCMQYHQPTVQGESPDNGSPHEISSLSCDIQLYSYCMTKHSLQANVFMHICMHLTCIKEIATSLLCSHFAFYDENEKVVPMTSQAVSMQALLIYSHGCIPCQYVYFILVGHQILCCGLVSRLSFMRIWEWGYSV